eukprot:gene7588-20_t
MPPKITLWRPPDPRQLRPPGPGTASPPGLTPPTNHSAGAGGSAGTCVVPAEALVFPACPPRRPGTPVLRLHPPASQGHPSSPAPGLSQAAAPGAPGPGCPPRRADLIARFRRDSQDATVHTLEPSDFVVWDKQYPGSYSLEEHDCGDATCTASAADSSTSALPAPAGGTLAISQGPSGGPEPVPTLTALGSTASPQALPVDCNGTCSQAVPCSPAQLYPTTGSSPLQGPSLEPPHTLPGQRFSAQPDAVPLSLVCPRPRPAVCTPFLPTSGAPLPAPAAPDPPASSVPCSLDPFPALPCPPAPSPSAEHFPFPCDPAIALPGEQDGPSPLSHLDELNTEQRLGLHLALSGHSMFLTGSAGTGKSFLLRTIIAELERRGKRVCATASTGLAAYHINGTTLNRFMGIGKANKDLVTLFHQSRKFNMVEVEGKMQWALRCFDVLVIDEVSMVGCKLFEAVEFLLRHAMARDDTLKLGTTDSQRRGAYAEHLPFGGVQTTSPCYLPITLPQVILCGDFFQLPPVSGPRAARPTGRFCFSSPMWPLSIRYSVALTQVMRQQDAEFIGTLERVRSGRLARQDLALLNRVHVPRSVTGASRGPRLHCTTLKVDEDNMLEMAGLASPLYSFEAYDDIPLSVLDAAAGCATEPSRVDLPTVDVVIDTPAQGWDSAVIKVLAAEICHHYNLFASEPMRGAQPIQPNQVHVSVSSEPGDEDDLSQCVVSVCIMPHGDQQWDWAVDTRAAPPLTFFKHNGGMDEDTFRALLQNRAAVAKRKAKSKDQGITVESRLRDMLEQMPAKTLLHLRSGCRVMHLRSIKRLGLSNGTLGEVIGFDTATGFPVVKWDHRAAPVLCYPSWFDVGGSSLTDGFTARRLQLPLQLAWALTIHKSQGMSLDRVQIDIGACFEPGQAYVALSRARSLAGLSITRHDASRIQSSTDALEFMEDNVVPLTGLVSGSGQAVGEMLSQCACLTSTEEGPGPCAIGEAFQTAYKPLHDGQRPFCMSWFSWSPLRHSIADHSVRKSIRALLFSYQDLYRRNAAKWECSPPWDIVLSYFPVSPGLWLMEYDAYLQNWFCNEYPNAEMGRQHQHYAPGSGMTGLHGYAPKRTRPSSPNDNGWASPNGGTPPSMPDLSIPSPTPTSNTNPSSPISPSTFS